MHNGIGFLNPQRAYSLWSGVATASTDTMWTFRPNLETLFFGLGYSTPSGACYVNPCVPPFINAAVCGAPVDGWNASSPYTTTPSNYRQGGGFGSQPAYYELAKMEQLLTLYQQFRIRKWKLKFFPAVKTSVTIANSLGTSVTMGGIPAISTIRDFDPAVYSRVEKFDDATSKYWPMFVNFLGTGGDTVAMWNPPAVNGAAISILRQDKKSRKRPYFKPFSIGLRSRGVTKAITMPSNGEGGYNTYAVDRTDPGMPDWHRRPSVTEGFGEYLTVRKSPWVDRRAIHMGAGEPMVLALPGAGIGGAQGTSGQQYWQGTSGDYNLHTFESYDVAEIALSCAQGVIPPAIAAASTLRQNLTFNTGGYTQAWRVELSCEIEFRGQYQHIGPITDGPADNATIYALPQWTTAMDVVPQEGALPPPDIKPNDAQGDAPLYEDVE